MIVQNDEWVSARSERTKQGNENGRSVNTTLCIGTVKTILSDSAVVVNCLILGRIGITQRSHCKSWLY